MSSQGLCFVFYLLGLETVQLQETFVQQKYSIAELEIKFAIGTFTVNVKMDAFITVKGYSIL